MYRDGTYSFSFEKGDPAARPANKVDFLHEKRDCRRGATPVSVETAPASVGGFFMSTVSTRSWSSSRLVIATATIAVAGIVAACSEGGAAKSVTAPQAIAAPRADLGISNAAIAKVCVYGPAGNYTLQNSNFVPGVASGTPGTTVRNDDGVGLHPAPGAQYTLTVVGNTAACVDVMVRTVIGSPLPDPFSSMQVTLVSGPAGTVWNHTECLDDEGLTGGAATSPCNVTNPVLHTNFFHGTQVTFFVAPVLPPAKFVIGDNELHGIGANVNFWGAKWWKNNTMTGFVSNGVAAFKGYADLSDNVCGGTWTSLPGNSSKPPKTIGDDVAIIVTSTVNKSGANITGNIVQILVVHQDGGYGPNPGHDGNGPVTSIICTAP
jgi:hypothetical protein